MLQKNSKKVEIFQSNQRDHVDVGISYYSHVFLSQKIQKSNCAKPEYVMMIVALVCSLESEQLNCTALFSDFKLTVNCKF